jgi:hypothetical protein
MGCAGGAVQPQASAAAAALSVSGGGELNHGAEAARNCRLHGKATSKMLCTPSAAAAAAAGEVERMTGVLESHRKFIAVGGQERGRVETLAFNTLTRNMLISREFYYLMWWCGNNWHGKFSANQSTI